MCLLFMCFWLMYLQEVVAVKVSEAAFQQMYSERSLEKHALYISFRDRKAVIEPPQRYVMELLLRWSFLPHFSEVNSTTIIVFFFFHKLYRNNSLLERVDSLFETLYPTLSLLEFSFTGPCQLIQWQKQRIR